MQLSSSVAVKPPCTVPAGLRWMSPGSAIITTRPFSASRHNIAQGLRDRIERQRAVGEPLDKFQAAHLLSLSALTVP